MRGRHISCAASVRRRRAATLVPLALLSGAWTANLAGVGAGASSSADKAPATSPDGIAWPKGAYKRPASYTRPDTVGLGAPSGRGEAVIAAASTNGIPTAALSAYQRAETVMNAADGACNVGWQLIAAIGRVESDHGRYGGNTLGVDGISRPGIYGIALNGKHKTQGISDTDAGLYDNDEVWNRAVGPMQFIPSTWSVVGVDADGDAKRNPQDIDDAALASAVYLCSGDDNLATELGQRKSVFRYNHSDEYVDLVLSIMKAYTEGDYTSVPNNIGTTVSFTRVFDGTRPSTGSAKDNGSGSNHPGSGGGSATTTPPAEEPTGPVDEPTDKPAPPGDAVKQVQQTLKRTTTTVTQLLTLPQAILKCTSLGYNAFLTPSVWNACITKYTE